MIIAYLVSLNWAFIQNFCLFVWHLVTFLCHYFQSFYYFQSYNFSKTHLPPINVTEVPTQNIYNSLHWYLDREVWGLYPSHLPPCATETKATWPDLCMKMLFRVALPSAPGGWPGPSQYLLESWNASYRHKNQGLAAESFIHWQLSRVFFFLCHSVYWAFALACLSVCFIYFFFGILCSTAELRNQTFSLPMPSLTWAELWRF